MPSPRRLGGILYDCADAPNARRAKAFLAEKDVEVRTVSVDPRRGETRSPWFLAKNPFATVPVLELPDGTCISESLAISQYVEALFPDPPLLGTDARARAEIAMWHERIEMHVMYAAASAVLHLAPDSRYGSFAQGMPRHRPAGENARERLVASLGFLDRRLADTEYIAGVGFSIVDITAASVIESVRSIGVHVGPAQHGLRRWYESILSRPAGTQLTEENGALGPA